MTADPLSLTFAALADPTRRAILELLTVREMSVTEMAAPFDISLPAISRHLKVLARAGLIERTREAQVRPCALKAEPLRRPQSGWKIPRALGGKFRAARRGAGGMKAGEAKRPVITTAPPKLRPPMNTQPPANSADHEIVSTRLFPVPRAKVFAAYADPAALAAWWGRRSSPTNFTLSSFAPAARGASRCHGPDGASYVQEKLFTEIVAPERIVVRQPSRRTAS